MDPLAQHRDQIIPHRMGAVEILNMALHLHPTRERPTPRQMKIYFDGKLEIDGLSTGFTNGAIESGILHCRVLLEFLGLKLKPGSINRLSQRLRKRSDDIGIEDYNLDKVTVTQATSKYNGSPQEAENALATVIFTAHKYLAHNTTMLLPENPDQNRLIEIASRGIPALMILYFYTPLGLPAPDYVVAYRRRDDA